MKVFTISSLFFSLFLISCESPSLEDEANVNTSKLNGKELMENKCYTCHNTQGTDNMLAPPMFRVKDHYWDEETTREEFITAIVDWCENPTEENSIMPGARRKFGLMPKQDFDLKEVEAIAGFLFDEGAEQNDCSH